MASTWSELGIRLMTTGENANAWGDQTNHNWNRIEDASDGLATVAVAGAVTLDFSAQPTGYTDENGRNKVLVFTGTAGGTQAITFPNIEKTYHVLNDSNSTLTLTTGTGAATVSLAAGKDMMIYNDGSDEIHNAFANLSTTTLITSGAITAASLDISGDIDVDGTTNLDAVDIDGAVDMASTLGVTGVVTANAGVVIDNITIDGTEIDLSSGDLTLDVEGDIILDANGGDIKLRDNGSGFAQLQNSSSDLIIQVDAQDKDIVFKGDDGGTPITPVRIDMSESGKVLIGGTGATYGELGITGAGNGDANIDLYASVGAGTEGKAEIFFSTDTSSDHLSCASIVMQQDGAGDRKGEILFNVSDNGGPAQAVLIQNNKNVIFSGSLGIGGTTSANLLDDYEEGTWTPSNLNGSNAVTTTHKAIYVKIGHIVHAFCDVTYASTPDDTSQANTLSGLPFSCSDDYFMCGTKIAGINEPIQANVAGTVAVFRNMDDGVLLTRSQLASNRAQHYFTYTIS